MISEMFHVFILMNCHSNIGFDTLNLFFAMEKILFTWKTFHSEFADALIRRNKTIKV